MNPKSYYRPKQNIPESQKTEQWRHDNVDWIIGNFSTGLSAEKENYDLYNGERDDSQWDHITKTYGIEFPAGKIKHIPLIRPLINELHGEASTRELNYTVLSADTDAINKKLEEIKRGLLMDVATLIMENKEVDAEMDALEKYYGNYKTSLEIAASKVLSDYISNTKLKELIDDCILDKFITGKQFYRAYVNRIGEDPIVEKIAVGNLRYSSEPVKWVKDCDWAVYRSYMTPNQVLDRYGDRLKMDDIKKIENWTEEFSGHAEKLRGSWDADRLIENNDQFNAMFQTDMLTKVPVYEVEFKSIRKITYVENENRYEPDAPFIKFLTEDTFENVTGKRKQNIRDRYVQDLYQEVRIGEDIYAAGGKAKYPVRSTRNPSKVQLTFNGPAFNQSIRPYSLIKITKDLQDLYDVMHYHKENLIALSGVKGSFMDLSQLPDFGTGDVADNIKMWMYYKKMGTAFIDRAKQGADRQFNQFQSYDDTLGAGLEAILATIAHIEETAGRIVGVNRQRLGAVTQRDSVGGNERAIIQSSLVTEPLFREHGEFTEQMLMDVVQACRIAYKNGYTSTYLSNTYEQKIFSVDASFSLSSYNIYIEDATKDKRSIQELKGFVYDAVRAGMADVEDVVPMFRKTSLKDIETTILSNMRKRKEMLMAQQQQQQQLQAQMEQATTQAELQKLQAEIQKLVSDIADNQKKLQLEEESLRIDADYKDKQVELDTQRVELEQKQLEMGGRAAEIKND